MQIKTLVSISRLLSWFNLSVAGLLCLFALISAMVFMGLLNALTPIVLLGSIVLHSYAALQLRNSIVTGRPLNRQTSTGIRFIGYIALFFSILYGGSGIVMLQNTKEMIRQIQLPVEYKTLNMTGLFRGIGVFALIFSVTILGNVVLNFRLLNWYHSAPREE